jgi:glycosyltransferase involved in cell wall biosynthesis
MKILIDARFYGLENTGIGRYTLELVNNLQKIDKKNKYSVLLKEKYFRRLNLPKNWRKIKAEIKHYSLAEQILIPQIIDKENPDLVHFVHFNVPVFCPEPFIVTIHDLLMHKQKGKEATTLPFGIYLLKRLGYRLVFDSAVKKSKAIVCPSNFIKKEIVDFYRLPPEKVYVTYEGIPVKAIREGSADKILQKYNLQKPYFIYTGNAYPHKNLERAIEAVVSLNKDSEQVINLALVCARNVFVQRLEKIIKRLKADNFVKILGFVPDADLTVLYKNSVAFLFPSLSEGFGLPGLEAMAAGTLVLTSDISVFRETYGKIPFYFNPYDYSSIEKKLKEVLALGEEERSNWILGGQKFARRYSWFKMAKQTIKVYEDCYRLRSSQ